MLDVFVWEKQQQNRLNKKDLITLLLLEEIICSSKKRILNIADKNDGKFLYIRGEDIAHNLEEDLKASGFSIDSVINYTTSLNPDFDQKTLTILKDQSIDLIFVYSNRSAAHLSKLIFNNDLESKCSSVQLRSLSENVFFPLKKIKWKNVKMFSAGNEQFSLD